MKLFIVPEDHRDDQYILKPLFEKLLADSRRVPGNSPNSHDVKVYQKTAGISGIKTKLPDVANKYGHYPAIVVAVDRDCEESRQQSVQAWIDQCDLEEATAVTFPCVAVEEVEAWLLGLYDDEITENWQDIRRECSLKERYFQPFMDDFGDSQAPGGGRKRLMKKGLKERPVSSLLSKCPELKDCVERIESLFE